MQNGSDLKRQHDEYVELQSETKPVILEYSPMSLFEPCMSPSRSRMNLLLNTL